jgi:hypothetical protein
MRRVFWIAILALLITLPASAGIKIEVDFDRDADFDSYKTFAWKDTPKTSLRGVSPLMHSRIKNAIEDDFAKGGLQQVGLDEDPDILITYHASVNEEVHYNTAHYGYDYGFGPGWGYYGGYYGGMGSSMTTSHAYNRGTLVVDIWDAKTKNLIFRGAAKAIVKPSPEKSAKRIDKTIKKMGKKFDKKLRRVKK